MLETPQRNGLVYFSFQYPGLPFTEVIVGFHKGI